MGRCFSFLLVIILSLVSCNKNEVIYSCNSEVNDWVNKNLYGISTMTRSEWKALDNEYKIPVFRAFSQEQRILFWKEKIKRNVERDLRQWNQLQSLGWNVIVVWECELKKDCFEKTMKSLEYRIKNHT